MSRADLIKQLSVVAKKKGFSLYETVNEILKLAIKAEDMNTDLRRIVEEYHILKTARDVGFVLGLESLWYRMAELTYRTAKNKAMKSWFEAGVWVAKRYVTGDDKDSFVAFTRDLEALTWNASRWQALIAESWWHETLRLYAAQADANTLVQACLDLNTEMALRLADEIEQEALTLAPAIRDTVKNALEGLVAISLRSEPMTVSQEEFIEVFKLDKGFRPLEYIQNGYEDQGEVVVDHGGDKMRVEQPFLLEAL